MLDRNSCITTFNRCIQNPYKAKYTDQFVISKFVKFRT